MSAQNPLLEVRHLRVEFPTRRGTLVALDDVSFTISAGEVLGVVGESGAGKSMTGAAIIGLLEPPGRIAAGEILLDGRRIDNLRYEDMRRIRGKDIGAIFQDPLTTLNPLYTVGRQLAETMTTHLPITPAEARKRAIGWLDLVGIPAAAQRIDSYPHEFSGGMRQRVVIALALCAEPRLIVADEPTTALDVSIQALTKYVGGHSDVLLGSITVNSEKDYEIVRGAASQMGHFAAPDDCWLALRGARTMPIRLKQQEKSGLEVAHWFENRPEVQSVLHPALPSHPQHALWKRDFTGACSLFGVVFKPHYTEADIFKFIDSLKLFGIGASWGGFESLALPTTGFITRTATSPDLGGFTVRIHIGLEDVGDLIADLTQGLATLPK